MAKRLSEEQKKEITKRFSSGESIDKLSEDFNCTNTTIIRNLKKSLGEIKYKELIMMGKSSDQLLRKEYLNVPINKDKLIKKDQIGNKNKDSNIVENIEQNFLEASPFIEITPLNYEIESSPQKDLSSIPISEIDFPKTVFMVVDKKIELEIKYLKDYPNWQFLSNEELNRKTIEIFDDLKVAKRICNKEQKIIKVSNTDVFRLVAPILLSKGISRIVNSDKLIAL
ncbi:MAG: hypothetical protein CM15mP13_3020 [Pseudomonadota bacterium]|nr:MAG: hypothetical protein CM15mP13_3020 [Pseudomonadota bacterium]